MHDPKKQLSEYLDNLIFKILNIKAIYNQILILSEWNDPLKIETLRIGSFFYQLTLFSYRRIIILELCKLLSNREEKSLYDFLKKLIENASKMKASVYMPLATLKSDRKYLSKLEYIHILRNQISEIDKHKDLLNKLLLIRDKDIAHADSSYFNNPDKLDKLYPIKITEIQSLIDLVCDILRKQHSLINKSDIKMEISSPDNIDKILLHVRAARRLWNDRIKIIKCGINYSKYFND